MIFSHSLLLPSSRSLRALSAGVQRLARGSTESKRVKELSLTKAKHKPLRAVEQTRPSDNGGQIEQASERVLTSAIKHLSGEVHSTPL